MRDLEIVEFGTTIENVPTYFVKCGCKTFVFLSKTEVVTFINQYIQDPDGYEKSWYEKHSDGTLTGGEVTERVSRTLSDTLRNR